MPPPAARLVPGLDSSSRSVSRFRCSGRAPDTADDAVRVVRATAAAGAEAVTDRAVGHDESSAGMARGPGPVGGASESNLLAAGCGLGGPNPGRRRRACQCGENVAGPPEAALHKTVPEGRPPPRPTSVRPGILAARMHVGSRVCPKNRESGLEFQAARMPGREYRPHGCMPGAEHAGGIFRGRDKHLGGALWPAPRQGQAPCLFGGLGLAPPRGHAATRRPWRHGGYGVRRTVAAGLDAVAASESEEKSESESGRPRPVWGSGGPGVSGGATTPPPRHAATPPRRHGSPSLGSPRSPTAARLRLGAHGPARPGLTRRPRPSPLNPATVGRRRPRPPPPPLDWEPARRAGSRLTRNPSAGARRPGRRQRAAAAPRLAMMESASPSRAANSAASTAPDPSVSKIPAAAAAGPPPPLQTGRRGAAAAGLPLPGCRRRRHSSGTRPERQPPPARPPARSARLPAASLSVDIPRHCVGVGGIPRPHGASVTSAARQG